MYLFLVDDEIVFKSVKEMQRFLKDWSGVPSVVEIVLKEKVHIGEDGGIAVLSSTGTCYDGELLHILWNGPDDSMVFLSVEDLEREAATWFGYDLTLYTVRRMCVR